MTAIDPSQTNGHESLTYRVWTALRSPSSYSPRRNPAILFGFLAGLPVPVIGQWVALSSTGQTFSLDAALSILDGNSLHWFLLFHPLMFMGFFGLLGALHLQVRDRHRRSLENLELRSNTDSLTGMFNHGFFHDRLEEEIERARRENSEFSVILADLDDFKKVNDNYGHQTGDSVLRHIAERLKTCCRAYDTPARYGGEEFAVLLPRTPAAEARAIATRMLQEAGKDAEASGLPNVTLSIGIATYPEDANSGSLLVNVADRRLYAAKRAGKNRYCDFLVFEPEDGRKLSGKK